MSKQPVTLPLLSDTMQTGRLARWLKQPGEAVRNGDVLAEVESDKAIMDVEAFTDGYLAGPLAPTDTDIPVKTTIAWITDTPPSANEPAETEPKTEDDATAPAPTADTTAKAETESTDTKTESPSGHQAETPRTKATETETPPRKDISAVVEHAFAAREGMSSASPFARGLATELGVDLSQVKPDKQGGISAAQVLAAALRPRSPHLELGPVHRIERPSPLKAALAERIGRSVDTPTFHVTIALNLAPLHDAAHAEHESLSLLLARACALSVVKHPDFNACWTPAGLARRERVDIAIAVDTPEGLITPVLRNVLRPLDELAEDWRELKGKLEKRRMTPADYTGATFYLSNLGTFPDIERFDAIVPLGAAAILAVAAPSADGLTRLTLSCDHRVVAGADAARFLTTLKEHLADVDSLMESEGAQSGR